MRAAASVGKGGGEKSVDDRGGKSAGEKWFAQRGKNPIINAIKRKMEKGIFITFEGGEGCGKTSHIAALAEYLRARGRECVVTREPGGTPLSEKIRALLLHDKEGEGMSARAEILLFEAARAQHVDELIRPALAAGKCVLCDRFFDSTTAYQGAARKLDLDDVKSLNAFAADGLEPDLTIVLDICAAEGLARAGLRDGNASDRMGSERAEFYESVRSAFLRLASGNPERFAVVDASGSKEETFAKVVEAVERKGLAKCRT